MKLVKTAKIKLNIKVEDILPTFLAYTKAFNLVAQIGFNQNDKNGVSLHKKTYSITREYLPSQLAISSRMMATEALRSVFTKRSKGETISCPHSTMCSIRYDDHSYSLFPREQQVSLLTINKRIKVKYSIPEYYKELFSSWKHTSATLCIKKNQVYLHISFEKDIEDIPKTGKLIGIDRGISKIAVTSNNKFFGGGIVRNQVRKYQVLRSKLQACGSKSAKRHLTRLAGKEQRFRADVNHVVSKKIITSLNPGDIIVLEDLKGIRDNPLRKAQRKLINSWSFYQLELFLEYKALGKGIIILGINPAYTSQKCSCCGYVDKKNRKTQSAFCCKKCGFKLNADLNASRNIRNKGLVVYATEVAVPTRSVGCKALSRAEVNQPIVGAPEALLTSLQPCAGGN